MTVVRTEAGLISTSAPDPVPNTPGVEGSTQELEASAAASSVEPSVRVEQPDGLTSKVTSNNGSAWPLLAAGAVLVGALFWA